MRREQQQQIGLAHDALTDLGVNQVKRDIGRREFGALGHFRQSFGQVDEGGAAVFGGEEEEGQVCCFVLVGAIVRGWSDCLRTGVARDREG